MSGYRERRGRPLKKSWPSPWPLVHKKLAPPLYAFIHLVSSALSFLQLVSYYLQYRSKKTRSSADADNGLDAFSGQSRSTNMVPFHMLHIVSYCATVTLSLRRAIFTIFVFNKFHDLEMGVKGHSRSLRVVSFDRLCMVSY